QRLAGRGIADLLEVVEVTVRVTGLALGGVAEQAGEIGVTLDVGDLREVEVAPVGLRLAGERVLEVLVGLAALQVGHRLLLRNSTTLVPRARARAYGPRYASATASSSSSRARAWLRPSVGMSLTRIANAIGRRPSTATRPPSVDTAASVPVLA